MGIIGIGIDIVHAPRIASLVARRTPQKLATRILSPNELREWKTICPPALLPLPQTGKELDVFMAEKWFRFLTVRWAVKEAAYKALFPLYKPTWKDLTVFKASGNGGKPGLAFEKFGEVSLHVSVSHDGEYTVANVLAEA
ncbi:4'-phosphopantetheinyl transferase [Thelephora terrestris]|uniref:4'-phosphopantetheinyl transferase n=1 Tax=Thelephora terrestris TaxID=56493 RepID=A0A9P6H4U1_9AGAM|nr:4'-phosphopantetheinyl transferase [Thelephora terrestris]